MHHFIFEYEYTTIKPKDKIEPFKIEVEKFTIITHKIAFNSAGRQPHAHHIYPTLREFLF